MKKSWIFILVLFVAVFSWQGCKSQNQEVAEDKAEAREDAREEANTPGEEAEKDADELADDTKQLGENTADKAEETADKAEDAAEDADDSKVAQDVESGVKEAGSEIKDAGITTAVKAKFAADDVVKASTIDVDTENGIVTLNGTVASTKESTRAVALAKEVDGVKDVRNRLTVQ
jgi:osmotically-inducible protein OsmY